MKVHGHESIGGEVRTFLIPPKGDLPRTTQQLKKGRGDIEEQKSGSKCLEYLVSMWLRELATRK